MSPFACVRAPCKTGSEECQCRAAAIRAILIVNTETASRPDRTKRCHQSMRRAYKLADWLVLGRGAVDAMSGIDAYPLQAAKGVETRTGCSCVTAIGAAAPLDSRRMRHRERVCFGGRVGLAPVPTAIGRTHLDRPVSQSSFAGSPLATPAVAKDHMSIAYDVQYALHLFQETGAPFLTRVESKTEYDGADISYFTKALEEDDGFHRLYQESYAVNCGFCNDVDDRGQRIKAEQRPRYRIKGSDAVDIDSLY